MSYRWSESRHPLATDDQHQSGELGVRNEGRLIDHIVDICLERCSVYVGDIRS